MGGVERSLTLTLGLTLGLTLAMTLACQGKPRGHPSLDPVGPDQHTRRDLDLNAEQEAFLHELAAAADEHPDDFEARKRSGLAHMSFTLAGVLRLHERAEQDLEAAFAIDPTDPLLNRSLGRFYNLRAVDGDDSKGEMQVKVYAALIGDQAVDEMDNTNFVAYTFFMLGQILVDKNGGHKLDALAKVNELEEQLAERVAREPDNIELRALAGNFAFFFAGNIPLSRERRVREAVAYFEVLRARWDELRVSARDPMHCPNTRENFMFELAEGYMVLERGAEARALYEELAKIRAPRTRAKELIAHVSEERLRNFDAYLGDMRLMPPWPSDVSNCVVCHAWSSDVGLESLYSVEEIRLSDVPSQAEQQPIVGLLNLDGDGLGGDGGGSEPVEIAERDRLPEPVAALIERSCAPCHFPGGRVVDELDLSTAALVEEHAADIEARVVAGEMPPGGGLEPAQREQLREWALALQGD